MSERASTWSSRLTRSCASRGDRLRDQPESSCGLERRGSRPGGRSTRLRSPVLVIADPDDRGWLGVVPGSRIETSGRLSPARAGEAFAAVIGARAPPEVTGKPPLVQRVAARLRAGLRQAVSRLPTNERG